MLWHMPRESPNERRVRLFKNGRNQAIRIPREFELPGEEAILVNQRCLQAEEYQKDAGTVNP